MPSLLFEIGCEELPAGACREAQAQLPELAGAQLGAAPSRVLIGPRRLAILVDDLPARTPDEWVKGPPVALRDKAAAGFARRYGVEPDALEERDGFLGVTVAGQEIAAVLPERLAAIVRGLQFSKSMVWGPDLRFSRPVRWLCAKLDGETVPVALDGIPSGGESYGHRFGSGRVGVPSAGAYAETLQAAGVEPDQRARRQAIEQGLDALGEWSDPLGKLDEVVYLVESPSVLESSFDERFLRLPERVIETAMQSHQRYFPLGGTRFAVVANGGDPAAIMPGYTAVLENRLDDAAFTFDRDVAKGIEGLKAQLGSITFVGQVTFAEATKRLADMVFRLGEDSAAYQAADLAKIDQAAELVREFPELEGHIGAEYARRAGVPEQVAVAIDEHYLPDGADAPLPSTETGRILAAADKLVTLQTIFELGKRPTGSSDPFALRRAAIGLCRLADEGGVTIPRRELYPYPDVHDFVEERLEGLLDVQVEFVRAARGSLVPNLGDVAALARFLAALDGERLATVHTIYTRAARLAGDTPGEGVREELFEEPVETELWQARPQLAGDFDADCRAFERLAPIVERYFTDVLVMAERPDVRANRLRTLAVLRDAVRHTLGDLSQIPL